MNKVETSTFLMCNLCEDIFKVTHEEIQITKVKV